MSARRWHGPTMPPPPRHRGVVRLLRWRWWGVGSMQAIPCGLCGCLVVAEGAVQHERHHQAGGTA